MRGVHTSPQATTAFAGEDTPPGKLTTAPLEVSGDPRETEGNKQPSTRAAHVPGVGLAEGGAYGGTEGKGLKDGLFEEGSFGGMEGKRLKVGL